MNTLEIAKRLADQSFLKKDDAEGIIKNVVELLIEILDDGGEIKLRGLGTLRWVEVSKSVPIRSPQGVHQQPKGRKLKFIPAKRFKNRRPSCQKTKD